jgi:alkanesulfonate monooxygenase SsuD/methylene tetrahydromethanopterin reductase-like flavin-dependent oxidoreductase (luciferase family)
MRRSLFWFLDEYPALGMPVASIHTATLEQARLADELGFDGLWLTEHHFVGISATPNPAVVLSAIAQHTERLRLGTAVSVLPLRNAIQVAEDYALVDILSNGRLNMGVGTGSQPDEFAGLGVDFESRQKTFDESLATLQQRWSKASAGERGVGALNVAPVQSPAPPIYVTSNREDGAREIGRQGHSLLTLVTPAMESLDEVAARIRAHKCGLEEGGHRTSDAEAVVVVFAHLADTLEVARSVASAALGRLLGRLAGAAPPDPAAIVDVMRERGTAVFGPAADLDTQLGRFAEVGVEHIAFASRFGGMEAAAVEGSLRALAVSA